MGRNEGRIKWEHMKERNDGEKGQNRKEDENMKNENSGRQLGFFFLRFWFLK